MCVAGDGVAENCVCVCVCVCVSVCVCVCVVGMRGEVLGDEEEP